MAITQKRLAGPARLSVTADTVIYTTPSSTTTILKQITICNTDSTVRTAKLSLLPTGESIGGQHTIISDISLAAGETVTLATSYVMVAGDIISGSASTATVVNIMLNGIEES